MLSKSTKKHKLLIAHKTFKLKIRNEGSDEVLGCSPAGYSLDWFHSIYLIIA